MVLVLVAVFFGNGGDIVVVMVVMVVLVVLVVVSVVGYCGAVFVLMAVTPV